MNYEKAYKEALEKIKNGLQPLPDGTKISGVTRAFLEEVFPELKESEDEKIRKALVRFHKSTIDVDGIKEEKIIAWLEKQGEKKYTWNVEDSSKVQRICQYLDEAKKYYADITEVRECMDWLKSLEDRVQPKPTEWSDEDEEYLRRAINATKDGYPMTTKWLKSLKTRLS